MTDISVCVCTFRRPSVLETLTSLSDMRLPDGAVVEVIVIDNDETPSARNIVEHFAESATLPIRYVHCPGANISVARNGALDASKARFLAFIDDDEVATPGWLEHLFAEQARTGAEIVLGPVEAAYGDTAPAWMRKTRLHATRPVWVDGTIRTGYTCNVLFDRDAAALANLRFDPKFGKSGGEDTVFFGAAHAAGARIAYASGAVVVEPVPTPREDFGWMARRKFRMGQTHAWLMLSVQQKNRWVMLPVAGAKAAYCALATLVTLPVQRMRNLMVLRFLLHAGVLTGLARGAEGQRDVTAFGAATE